MPKAGKLDRILKKQGFTNPAFLFKQTKLYIVVCRF